MVRIKNCDKLEGCHGASGRVGGFESTTGSNHLLARFDIRLFDYHVVVILGSVCTRSWLAFMMFIILLRKWLSFLRFRLCYRYMFEEGTRGNWARLDFGFWKILAYTRIIYI